MDRRSFLGSSLGALFAGDAVVGGLIGPRKASAARWAAQGLAADELVDPRAVRLNLKPVMTNMIHTGVWEGPCRFSVVSVSEEKTRVDKRFRDWAKQIERTRLNLDEKEVNVLKPVHITFCEDYIVRPEQLNRLRPDLQYADAFLVIPQGASIASYQIGQECKKPIILSGTAACRRVDIAAYSRSKGLEVHIARDSDQLRRIASLLRARKVFSLTKVLFPTDRGLPPVASVTSINDLQGLKQRFGIEVEKISYKELAQEMDRVMASKAERWEAERFADELIENANKSYLDRQYVVRSVEFYQAIKNLMQRHRCNAFTIECFEFCASKLPQKWTITPCLIHTLFKDQGYASACEADFGALLSMRLLMSVSGKSPHLGNVFLRRDDTLAVNHSVPGIRMNGFDERGLPYQLGRFVESGWGTKVAVDFMNNNEKRVTVARIDPTATKMLLLKGQLVGASGWGRDNLGCSVEARIKPQTGSADEFVTKQGDYGNHLIWVYGDYAEQMKQLGELLSLQVELCS